MPTEATFSCNANSSANDGQKMSRRRSSTDAMGIVVAVPKKLRTEQTHIPHRQLPDSMVIKEGILITGAIEVQDDITNEVPLYRAHDWSCCLFRLLPGMLRIDTPAASASGPFDDPIEIELTPDSKCSPSGLFTGAFQLVTPTATLHAAPPEQAALEPFSASKGDPVGAGRNLRHIGEEWIEALRASIETTRLLPPTMSTDDSLPQAVLRRARAMSEEDHNFVEFMSPVVVDAPSQNSSDYGGSSREGDSSDARSDHSDCSRSSLRLNVMFCRNENAAIISSAPEGCPVEPGAVLCEVAGKRVESLSWEQKVDVLGEAMRASWDASRRERASGRGRSNTAPPDVQGAVAGALERLARRERNRRATTTGTSTACDAPHRPRPTLAPPPGVTPRPTTPRAHSIYDSDIGSDSGSDDCDHEDEEKSQTEACCGDEEQASVRLRFRLAPRKQGTLKKCSRGRTRANRRSWRTRFFELRNAHLCYYKPSSGVRKMSRRSKNASKDATAASRGQQLKGVFPLRYGTVRLLKPSAPEARGKPNCFQVQSGVGKLVLQAADAEQRLEWVSAIVLAIAAADGQDVATRSTNSSPRAAMQRLSSSASLRSLVSPSPADGAGSCRSTRRLSISSLGELVSGDNENVRNMGDVLSSAGTCKGARSPAAVQLQRQCSNPTPTTLRRDCARLVQDCRRVCTEGSSLSGAENQVFRVRDGQACPMGRDMQRWQPSYIMAAAQRATRSGIDRQARALHDLKLADTRI